MGAKKPKRTIELVRTPDANGIGVLAVTQRRKTKFYAFWEIPCAIGGRGFVVHQIDQGPVYHVRIGSTEDCSCECLGFLRHSRCKHIEGLLELNEAGVLAEVSQH